MRVRKLRIVATGIQKNGQPVTKEQLESVVRNYKSDSRPPVTPGHPTKGSDKISALGRTANLRTEDYVEKGVTKTGLFGEVHYTPELEAREDNGEFEGFSAGIHPVPEKENEWYMHHLAVLGQLPPAADTKTLDVINLSDSDFSDDCIYLSADVGSDRGLNMNEKQLAAMRAAMKEVVNEQLTAAGVLDKDGKPVVPPESSTKPNDEDDPTNGKSGGENQAASTEVKALQESMAGDRREQLTELSDSRDMTDGMRKSIKAMIDGVSAIELCASGDSNKFNELKMLLKEMPEKASNASSASSFDKLLEEINLADEGNSKTGAFDSKDW